MNLISKLLAAVFVALCLSLSGCAAAPLRVLYFSKSSGWEHSVVKWENGQPSYTEKVLAKLGPAQNIDFTFSKDGSKFSKEYLAQFDVILFYTSGDLLSVGTDGQPAMTPAGKQALLDAIAGGKGFVGVHSCCDTFHTNEHGGGNSPIKEPRFHNFGDGVDPFIGLLGGEFLRHGPQQVATARVVAPDFPGFGGLGGALSVKEEWYTLRDFPADIHVQLVLETKGMEGIDYQRPPFPIAWARHYGKGRVAANAMGHREDVWDSAAFQAMLIGALNWAGGRVTADLTPNLETVAPGHATIQPFAAPAEPVAK